MTGTEALLIVVLLAANAFFVAAEFALVASRRSKLSAMADTGHSGAARALDSMSNLSLQLAGAQLGITIASLILGRVAEPAVAHGIEKFLHDRTELPESVLTTIGFSLGLTIVVFLHMVIGEMIPKNIAIAQPEKTLLALNAVNRLYLKLFSPVIAVLNGTANVIVRLLGQEPTDELEHVHTSDELADMVAASREEGLIAPFEDRLLRGALRIGEAPVRSIMVPRDRIKSVSRHATPVEAEETVVSTGHSRLLVVGEGGLDDVLGFVHAKDLLRIPGAFRDRPLPLGRIRVTPIVAPDTAVDDVLAALQRARVHVAIVADPDGNTLGLVTLEDVLEELVGDIVDETDRRARRRIRTVT